MKSGSQKQRERVHPIAVAAQRLTHMRVVSEGISLMPVVQLQIALRSSSLHSLKCSQNQITTSSSLGKLDLQRRFKARGSGLLDPLQMQMRSFEDVESKFE
jgi:hypothetical protein